MTPTLALAPAIRKRYDCGMPTLYARVSDQTYDYLKSLADDAQVSVALATDLVVDEARRRGWRLTPKPRVKVAETE